MQFTIIECSRISGYSRYRTHLPDAFPIGKEIIIVCLDWIRLFGFLRSGKTIRMEGVTSNGSTYPNWTGPRADWRAILSSLINARVMDSVGFKPACSCWRHNRQDITTLATLNTITMLYNSLSLSLVFTLLGFGFSFCYFSLGFLIFLFSFLERIWSIPR